MKIFLCVTLLIVSSMFFYAFKEMLDMANELNKVTEELTKKKIRCDFLELRVKHLEKR